MEPQAPLSRHFALPQPPHDFALQPRESMLLSDLNNTRALCSYGGWRSSQGVGRAGSLEALAVPLFFPAAKATTPWLMADTPAATQPAQVPILSQGSSYSVFNQRGGKRQAWEGGPELPQVCFGIRESVTEDGL